MPATRNLPTREDGVGGLLQLADDFGADQAFSLIRLCRTAQSRDTDTAGAAMRTLGAEMVAAEAAAGTPFKKARQVVADRLGYKPTGRPNFYDLIKTGVPRTGGPWEPWRKTRLPNRDDGVDGLLQFADLHGAEQVFNLIRLCRTAQNRQTDIAGAALRTLAQQMVAAEQRDSAVDYGTARQNVADRLGFTKWTDGNGRNNFYQLLAGTRPVDNRARAEFRKD